MEHGITEVSKGNVDERGMREFLESVTERIRWKQARKPVERELKAHIQDQREDFEHDGMDGQQALDMAVKEMGDPVQIGNLMNRVHKPRMSWTLFAMVAVASLVGILLQLALLSVYRDRQSLRDAADSLVRIADSRAGEHFVKNQILYSALGIGIMLFIRRFDYRKLKKYVPVLAAGFSAFFILTACFSRESSGMWFRLGGISFNRRVLILLAIPIFALLIYRYKGEGCRAAAKLFAWNLLFTFPAFLMPAFSSAVIVSVSNLILFCIATAKGWFQISRRWVFGVTVAILGASALLAVGLVWSDTVSGALLADYQTERIRYLFGRGENGEYYNYQGMTAGEIMEGSKSFGYDSEILEDALVRMPGLGDDYTLVGLTAAFGSDVGILAVLLLSAIAAAAVVISLRQRDDCGKILGISCGLVFFFETLISVLMALRLMPSTMAILPFISQGGSQILVMYILTGLVLSIQRYRDITVHNEIAGQNKNAEAESRSFRLARLKITVEKM